MSSLPPQLYVGPERPCSEKFEPAEKPPKVTKELDGQTWQVERASMKPKGGIWTSTELKDGKSQWTRWITNPKGMKPNDEDKVWRLIPEDDVSLYRINSREDLEEICVETDSFNQNEYRIEFETIIEEYDGIWLTPEGASEVAISGLAGPDLGSWDVESIIWFEWCFETVEKVREL